MAELQTYIGDFKAASQGQSEDPVPGVGTSVSCPAGEVVRIMQVSQGCDVVIIIRPLERVGSID